MLAVVEQSPRAVAAQDRQAWLGMFSQLAVIEDPVGSAPHISGIFDPVSGRRGDDALRRFYNTFIEGNRIEFVIANDIVVGNKVLRDLALKLEVNGMQATVPMHLVYELVFEQKELKVQRLSAHWEFFPMSRQMMNSNLWGMLAYSKKLIQQLGFSGVMGFMRAARSVGEQGKQAVADFIAASNANQLSALEDLFDPQCSGIVFEGDSALMSLPDFGLLDTQLTTSKLIAAGNRVSCSLQMERDGRVQAGAGLFEFNWKTRKLDKVRFFFEPVDAMQSK